MTSELKGRSSDFKPSAFLRAPTCLPQQGDHLWGQPEALGCPHVLPHQRQHSQASGAGRGAPPLTNDREGACDLCRAEGVGDLTNVGAAVLSPQVTDGQPRDALGPAAVGWEGSAILEPADGRDGVTGGGAGQLHGVAGPHFLGMEAVQDGGDRLSRVWKAESMSGPGQSWEGWGGGRGGKAGTQDLLPTGA